MKLFGAELRARNRPDGTKHTTCKKTHNFLKLCKYLKINSFPHNNNVEMKKKTHLQSCPVCISEIASNIKIETHVKTTFLE